ncbi:hypothetical protein Angca_003153 [Angiostrongylus cantonensis]|nr:hypothetical protein Angca_003153 [Angiostrongylus cantonensis]
MKHSWPSLPVVFVYLCFMLFLILAAEYWRYAGNDIASYSDSTRSSTLYDKYCVHYNMIAPKFTDFDRITQIVHVSADVLDKRIIEQVENWDGPVSMSVVLRSVAQYHCTARFLKKIRRLSADVERHLRAHLVFPKTLTTNCSAPFIPPSLSSASECEKHQVPSVEQIALYPANIARNIARIFSASKYIVIADYEHFFSKGFEKTVRAVAHSRLAEKPRTMLVYRIFEVDERVKELPQIKTEHNSPTSWANAFTTVPCRSFVSPFSHPVLSISAIINHPSTGLIPHLFRYTRWNWEPQFVSHWQIPLHDENFPFQLRDNTVLRWEMCRANYTIDVLDDVFVFHRGIKRMSVGGKVLAVQKRNAARFERALLAFKERMNNSYPNTAKLCPPLQR